MILTPTVVDPAIPAQTDTRREGPKARLAAGSAAASVSGKSSPNALPQPHDEAKLNKLGLYTPSALDRLIQEQRETQYVLDGLISRSSVNLAAGDSGLGKSPLFYQLALSVASGRPWLGIPTAAGPVIYIDLENNEEDSKNLRNDLARHLGLEASPQDFYVHFGGGAAAFGSDAVKSLILETHPSLVIIDSLRAFKPEAEKDNTAAASVLHLLRGFARKYKVAFLLVHHIRKPGENGVPALEDTPANQWLNQASGARALINQTDFRLGVDSATGASRRLLKKTSPAIESEMALILRGHVRVRGEFGPIYLSRSFNEEGRPVGYKKMSAIELLNNPEQQHAFERLPASFGFKDAKHIYGRRDQATSDFLDKATRLDLLRKTGRGQYEKKLPSDPVE